jgi:hypothetical protein
MSGAGLAVRAVRSGNVRNRRRTWTGPGPRNKHGSLPLSDFCPDGLLLEEAPTIQTNSEGSSARRLHANQGDTDIHTCAVSESRQPPFHRNFHIVTHRSWAQLETSHLSPRPNLEFHKRLAGCQHVQDFT